MSRPRQKPRLPEPPASLSKYRQKKLAEAADTVMGQKLLQALAARSANQRRAA